MKVKEFIKQDVYIDVVDNVCEKLYISFCGPLKLTDEGKAVFETALNLDITVDEENGVAVVDVEDEFFPDMWKWKLRKAIDFFCAAAGLCSCEDWNAWFED